MRPGDLVHVKTSKKSDKIAIIISCEKKSLAGLLFQVLHKGGLEWVCPENVFPVVSSQETTQK